MLNVRGPVLQHVRGPILNHVNRTVYKIVSYLPDCLLLMISRRPFKHDASLPTSCTAAAQLVIHVARRNCYAATVNGRLTVKLGGRFWTPAFISVQREEWTLVMRGYYFTVWLKKGIPVPEDARAMLHRTRSARNV